MKKNIAMRVAAILFILTMISTCAFSTTFAKYVTSANTEDSARVAKWGVVVSANMNDLFEKGYMTDNTATTEQASATVLTSADYQMLAPGTMDSQVDAIAVTGTPEVAVKLDYSCTVTFTNWTIDANDYCPLVITITVGTTPKDFKIDGTNIHTVAELKTAIETYCNNDIDKTYQPNVDLKDNNDISIAWAWAYEGDNAKDTALGNQAAAGNPATFKIEFGLTVTQVD